MVHFRYQALLVLLRTQVRRLSLRHAQLIVAFPSDAGEAAMGSMATLAEVPSFKLVHGKASPVHVGVQLFLRLLRTLSAQSFRPVLESLPSMLAELPPLALTPVSSPQWGVGANKAAATVSAQAARYPQQYQRRRRSPVVSQLCGTLERHLEPPITPGNVPIGDPRMFHSSEHEESAQLKSLECLLGIAVKEGVLPSLLHAIDLLLFKTWNPRWKGDTVSSFFGACLPHVLPPGSNSRDRNTMASAGDSKGEDGAADHVVGVGAGPSSATSGGCGAVVHVAPFLSELASAQPSDPISLNGVSAAASASWGNVLFLGGGSSQLWAHDAVGIDVRGFCVACFSAGCVALLPIARDRLWGRMGVWTTPVGSCSI